ncbi:hypothetical protein B9T31_05540 [Acinetobacter sp. ANC 4558]|nr:hypothetical protein B9T31_05540 [Acinetobacter sp. ANC 4558]
MNLFKLNTLSHKLFFAISLWLIGALFFVGLTLNITWKLEDRGIAINEAGSLRKQVYYLVILAQSQQNTQLHHEINVFEEKIKFLSILNNTPTVWNPFEQAPYTKQIERINREFKKIKPQFIEAQNNPQLQHQLILETPYFIEQINQLVKNIESQNTHNIYVMRIAQILLMFMAFVSALLSLHLLNRLVIRPLSSINEGLQKITQGDLNVRLNLQTHDEFHQVSVGFNQMANSLENSYQNLEHKVQQKTQDLEKTNHELATLYSITDHLHKMPFDHQMLDMFLQKMMDLSFAKAGSIRLLNQQGLQMWTAHHINLPHELIKNKACNETKSCLCGTALCSKSIHINIDLQNKESTEFLCRKFGLNHLIVYKIHLREQTLGLMTLYFEKSSPEAYSNQSLIQLLCGQFATTIENNRLVLKEKQLAVLEERNMISQGLHDSIAQSLSFMNMQLQMLNQAIKKQDQARVEKHLDFLNTGIKQCYDDVRELLNNFRLKLNQQSFEEVLYSIFERFKKQTNIEIELKYQSSNVDLTPQQHIQFIFIIQEALSNVRKHSHAKKVTIHFNNNTEIIVLSIQDNGIGFNYNSKKPEHGHHIGLNIMQERIKQVNGSFHIESTINQGTCIHVSIQRQQL